MLSNQRCDYAQRSKSQTKLEVQGVVDCVIQALVSSAQCTTKGSAFRRIVCSQDFFDAVTDTKVSTVHVPSNDEQYSDRQVVMRDVSHPKRLSLRMETTKESQDCSTSTLRCAKHMTSSIRILSINAPVACKERRKPCWMRRNAQEVVPTHMNTARFRNRNVNHVTSPSKRAGSEQTSQVVV